MDREEALFCAALDRRNADERRQYLDKACSGDRDLRGRVERLLAAHAGSDSLLDPPLNVAAVTCDAPSISERPGDQIGPYKLLQEIGAGGFGVVYMAEQVAPVRRRVALKIIKPGMDSREVIARFEAERQALAMMDHPNIAKVLDAGATGSGRPYFVMELVKGVPITQYCDDNSLPTQERLKLFTQVCHAVQHAHQKGVIHRDLKPSNVMVTLHDGVPVAKVIDFGVAKAINQQLTARTLFTTFGQMVGTPAYMSPEQAEMSGLDIDTRSDIYSLGVLLYELLTGTTPLESDRLRKAGYAEIQRLIREEEPPKPSTRLSTCGEQLTTIAKHRSIAPDRLRRLVRGDLDWIVMKALEKDRSRRYETPQTFGEDICRFLSHDAILARPAATTYRLRKFVRRNRALVGSIAAIVFALSTGLAGTSWMAVTANAHLRKLVDSVTRESMMAALAGEEQRAIEALNAAKVVGVKHGDIDLIEGLVALNRGDLERAMSLAKESKRGASSIQSADRIGALSLLANAQHWSLAFDETGVQVDRLLKMQPQTDIEKLLHASAIVGFSPVTTLELLGKEPDIARTPVGFFVRGQATLIDAFDKHDEQKVMEALSDLKAAHFLLGGSIAARRWHAIAVYCVMDMAFSDGRTNDAERYAPLGTSLADQLGADPNSQWIRWYIYRLTGDYAKATEACSHAHSHGWCGYVAADCLLNDDYPAAIQRFDRWCNGRSNKYTALSRAHLAVGDAEGRKWVREQMQLLLGDPSTIVRRHAISALCLVCTADEVREFAKKSNQSPAAQIDSLHDLWAGDHCLQFFAEPDSPEPLLTRAGGHRFALGDAHFTIGMMSLARGNRQAAFEHFRQCHEIRQNTIDGVLGSLYYEKMSKDPNWPAWLRERVAK